MTSYCPYCGSTAEHAPDPYGDGGYRDCCQGHTFHVEDWERLA